MDCCCQDKEEPFNFRVAIPTYKRHKTLGDKTLKTLENHNIPKNIIDIFVNNQEEYELYKPLYSEYNIIVGEVGMKEIREFIFNYYNEGDKIFCIDDDIIAFKKKNDNLLDNVSNLRETIDTGFNLCEENKTCLFGIYPVENAFFMKDNYTTHLSFCVGWCFGVIIDKEVLKLNVAQYEDYERTIKVFKKYGKVIRMNNICASTKYSKKDSGGMNDDNRVNIMKRDLEIIMTLYGDYINVVKKKSSLIGCNPQIKRNIKNII